MYHIAECGECLNNHYVNFLELSFTDSYIVDIISDYFHRYSETKKLGSYYYVMMFSSIISEKIITLQADKMSYLNYIFKYKKQAEMYKLIHRGIIMFFVRNGKGDIIRDYDMMKKIRWRISVT